MEAIQGLRFPFFIGGVRKLECPLLEVPLNFSDVLKDMGYVCWFV